MAISDGRTEASATKRKLTPIVNSLSGAITFFALMDTLVTDEIITAAQRDSVVDDYKGNVLAEVTAIQDEEEKHADDIGRAGVIETNDKVEHIAPIIASIPVILPAPSTYTTDNVTLLSDQAALEAAVVAQIVQINAVMT